MPRRHHVMRAGKSNRRPRYCIFVDTETIQTPISESEVKHDLFLGVAYYVDYGSKKTTDELIFDKSADFWEWAASKVKDKKTLYIFAHNQDFDFRVMEGFTHLQRLGYHPHCMIFESPPTILTFGTQKKRKGKIVKPEKGETLPTERYIKILDTLNWFRESLDALGRTLGVPKLPMPAKDAPHEEWVTYCRQDVLVLQKTLEMFWNYLNDNDMGAFSPTLAGQSLSAFKHKYMKHEITVHDDKESTEIERASYYGGRVECFRIGTFTHELFYKLDLNSMYPAVMRDNNFPVKCARPIHVFTDDLISRLRKSGAIIANVDVSTSLPLVPYRLDNKLCFPVGEFNATLCQPELDLLDQFGQSYKINYFVYYQTKPIFKDFVEKMYSLRLKFREEGNEQYQYMTKILMNSLYGKLGQQSPDTQIVGHDGTSHSWVKEIWDMERKKQVRVMCVNGEWIEQGDKKDGWDTFVAIPAFVTSYARAMLARIIMQAGQENVYYCDTDSVFVNYDGYSNLGEYLHETRLGALKKECVTTYMAIHNLKDYCFASDEKIKGVSKKAICTGPGEYQVQQWEHFRGALMRERPETVVTKQSVKNLSRLYSKGNVSRDGNVTPFRLYNDSAGS